MIDRCGRGWWLRPATALALLILLGGQGASRAWGPEQSDAWRSAAAEGQVIERYNVDLLGQVGGLVYAVAVQGSYA